MPLSCGPDGRRPSSSGVPAGIGQGTSATPFCEQHAALDDWAGVLGRAGSGVFTRVFLSLP